MLFEFLVWGQGSAIYVYVARADLKHVRPSHLALPSAGIVDLYRVLGHTVNSTWRVQF